MAISERKTQAKRQRVRLNVQLPLELKEALDQQAAKLNTTSTFQQGIQHTISPLGRHYAAARRL